MYYSSRHVIQLKKDGSNYVIPFEMPFQYSRPQVDSIPAQNQVTIQSAIPSVTDVEAAVALYLESFREQFRGQHGADRRAGRLARFLTYLQMHQHSMQLAELTYADGQTFLDTLLNAYTGEGLSPSVRRNYKSALRSFSRYLVKIKLTRACYALPERSLAVAYTRA